MLETIKSISEAAFRRAHRDRSKDKKRARFWMTTNEEVVGIAESYGLSPMPENDEPSHEASVQSVRSVRTDEATNENDDDVLRW